MENNTVTYKIDMTTRPALAEVLQGIADKCAASGAAAAVVSFADCPFLNDALTAELIEHHFKYSAEYTFADGYPGGLAPEILDAGAAKILLEMAKRTSCAVTVDSDRKTVTEGGGEQPMTRTGLWDLIQTDVNAFQIETVIAPHDYRLWRLDFHTLDKRGAMACWALLKAIPEDCEPWDIDAETLCQIAIRNVRVVRTVPAFYQVETRTTQTAMPLDKAADLAQQMIALSGDAVVSIDTADPEYIRVLSQAGLDILIETDESVTEDAAVRCHDIDPNIRWIINMTRPLSDASGSEHCIETTSPTDQNIALLHKYFPGRVYPQLVRTAETEPQLEAFYRKWSAPDSPSGGKVLITKYCSYCGALPDLKPADLSPLERGPCWHLRRDMVILSDGTVPLCFARKRLSPLVTVDSDSDRINPSPSPVTVTILGNVFTDGLAALWDKMEPFAERDLQYCLAATPLVTVDSDSDGKNLSPSPVTVTASDSEPDDLCRKCDEYYTFNF